MRVPRRNTLWSTLFHRSRSGARKLVRTLLGDDSRKISRNIGWLTGERIFNLIVSVGLSIWLARYLGPTEFGLYSYVTAFVSLFGFLTILGLDGIATRELVLEPEARSKILGTTLALRLIGSMLAIAVIASIAWIQIEAPETRTLMMIVATGLIFESLGVMDTFFNSRTEARYSVVARSITLVLSGVATVVLFLLEAPLIAFLAVIPARQAVKAICFATLYQWTGNHLLRLRSSARLARTYLFESWPLILSFASALVYLKMDQVMLGSMMGNTAVGIYSVAARLSESWYFLGPVIAISVFPSIVNAKKESLSRYRNRLQNFYSLMAWIAIAVAVAVTLAARPVITILYGGDYAEAATVLSVHIWTCPVVFMGAILNKWLINEKLYMFALTRNLLGAAANVTLNLLLIPSFGIIGSAFATLISYSAAHYLACFTTASTREAGFMMTRAVFAPIRLLTGGR